MMIKRLSKKKSVEQLVAELQHTDSGMKRTLGPWNLISLGVGAVIGAGVFVLTGNAAAQYAGPAITVSFVIAGLACCFAGLCYAEFAAMIPIAGSAYTYSYATLGEFVAWIIGWDLILEYLFASSTVAVGWSGYVVSFMSENLGLHIPHEMAMAPFTYDIQHGWGLSGAWINFPAVFIVVLITTLLVLGIKESTTFNNIIVLIKVVVILLFVGFGLYYVNADNWVPFIPDNTGVPGHYGWSGVFRGAAVIFFAYIGFDAVSTAALEAKNPQRDMPIGILVSLVVCTILYILVSLVLTGIVKYDLLNVPSPIAVAVDSVGKGLAWLSPIVKLGAIAGLSSVILVMLMGQPRIFYTMSRDGLLPPYFGRVHPRFKTPHIASIITGVAAAVIAGLFPIGILGELVSIGTLLAFTIVCLGVLVLRYNHPSIHRPFKTPFMPFVPILGAGFAVFQMASLPFDTWLRLIIWMAIGLLIYFTYSFKNSKIHKSQNNKPEVG